MIALGDHAFYIEDGVPMRAYVTRVVSETVVDLAVHTDGGLIIHGVTEAELAKTDAERKTDGFWYPRT